ncbi:unnamed protein product [Darwinula stevensoni]|uniref:Uncharacterized protein n=1 Tax=Darwinula stevensoni TaxID=69355 RepID=A0A7R8XCI7_9CRUS|nr:unnamed protein product [Darwinula stevensoni]CAG0888878.1 unnamed protein product [Darwinula stevensoni]
MDLALKALDGQAYGLELHSLKDLALGEHPHKCKDSKEIAQVRKLQEYEIDPRKHMKVRMDKLYSFTEGAAIYQTEHYPDAENSYAFPAGYVLKVQDQKKLFEETRDFTPDSGKRVPRIKPADSAVVNVFQWVKEIFSGLPCLVIYDYDFNETFYAAMGITKVKGADKKRQKWKKEGFETTDGDHDACVITFQGCRVLVVFFEVKAREIADSKLKDDILGHAEDQLRKSEVILRQFVGATASSHTFLCSFVALPYLSRSDVARILECSCHEHILTKDDLDSHDALKKFFEEHGILLTGQERLDPAAKDCYLDVMRTYVAASASVKGMPRTEEDLHKNIDERMETALDLLTPHQGKILLEDRPVLFLAGAQGTGKTYLLQQRAKQLAERGDTVIIVNMSNGELTDDIRKWRESVACSTRITVVNSTAFLTCHKHGVCEDFKTLFQVINGQKQRCILSDEMQVNFGMKTDDPAEIGQIWKNFIKKKKFRSLWIAWRPSDIGYPQTLDIQRVMDSLGREQVELLTEVKRNTTDLGRFVVAVTLFIQRRFSCLRLLPMQSLEYGLNQKEDLSQAIVLLIRSPPECSNAAQWASEVVVQIQLPSEANPGHFTIITRTIGERNVLVRELEDRLGQAVAFLDSEGCVRGHSNSKFLIFYQDQVTGMSFENLILLDDGNNFYRSWSSMVSMARRSLHVIYTEPLPTGHWEEPTHLELIRSLKKPSQPSFGVYLDPLDENAYAEISWIPFMEPVCRVSPIGIANKKGKNDSKKTVKIEERKIELLFGSNRSGKTAFLMKRLKRKTKQEIQEMRKAQNETISPARVMFVDCSRWNITAYPRGLCLVDAKERIKRAGLGNVAQVFDIHELLWQYELWNHQSLSPQVMQELLVKMLREGKEEGRRLHIALDDAPIHLICPGLRDTEGLQEEWESVLRVLSSKFEDTLASLTIAFQPYIDYGMTTFDLKKFKLSSEIGVRIIKKGFLDVGFSHLLRYILSHESPRELRVKPGTLNTRPEPSSLVFGVKPTLITPPIQTHYHGGFKCIGGRGRGCVAVTAAAHLLSHNIENVIVLISDEEILGIFTEVLGLVEEKRGAAGSEVLQIYHPRDYRGCESSQVMCVGIEDSWVVEGISRAIRTLFIVDGGTSAAAQSRMGLWKEMKRKDARRIFAMGIGEDGRGGIWEVLDHSSTLWVQGPCGTDDVVLVHSHRLIQCRGKEVKILHLGEKDPRQGPYEWDEAFHIPHPFRVNGTAGVVIHDTLFLLGGQDIPQEGRRLDLSSETWLNLPEMRLRRSRATSMMRDPYTILVLGGEDPETRRPLSSWECLDTRMRQWFPFPHDMPLPVSGHAVTTYNSHVYISGGWDGREAREEVWRCGINGDENWEELPSLNIKRHDHGMMGDVAKGLSIIGGRYISEPEETVEVLETETLTLDIGRWVCGQCAMLLNHFIVAVAVAVS